jgi:ABC-type branched-subunit amino acid transport system substrate-binding protein
MTAKKLIVFTLLAILLLLSTFACGGGEDGDGGVKEVKFGWGLPLSGIAGAILGIPAKQALELANEQIGEFTVAGERYRWDLIIEDNMWTSAGGVATANKFIYEDGVKIMHQNGADAGTAAQSICEGAGVLLDIAGGGLEAFGPGKPHTFQVCPTYLVHTPVFLQWLTTAHPEVKRVALVNSDDLTGHMVADAIVDAADYFGLEVVANEFVPPGTTELYPTATKVVATNPDLVEIAPGSGWATFRELGYEGLGAHVLWMTTLGESAGWDNVQGFLNYQPNPFGEWLPQEVKDFAAEYEHRYGTELTMGSWWGAMILQVHTSALENAGTVDDIDKIIATMETEALDTMLGPLRYGGEGLDGIGHMLLWPAPIAEIRDDQFVVIAEFPPEEAEALAAEVYK